MVDEELIKQLQQNIEQLTEEVRALKEQVENQKPTIVPYVAEPSSVPEACRHCSSHPSNGGSGICHCTLGSYTIT